MVSMYSPDRVNVGRAASSTAHGACRTAVAVTSPTPPSVPVRGPPMNSRSASSRLADELVRPRPLQSGVDRDAHRGRVDERAGVVEEVLASPQRVGQADRARAEGHRNAVHQGEAAVEVERGVEGLGEHGHILFDDTACSLHQSHDF